MARGGRKKESREKEEKREAGSKKRSTAPVARRRQSLFDLDKWVDERLDELALRFEIEYLGLERGLLKEVVKRVIEALWEEDKRPDIERVYNRYKRNQERIRQLIAQVLVESGARLTDDQLEYVVSSGGPWILSHAPSLYKTAVERGREDLVSMMRVQWIKWWQVSRGPELPPECPRCRFNSLMPDLTCIVCGYSPTPTEVLRHTGFDSFIEVLAKRGSLDKIRSVLEKGFVVVSSSGIKLPDEEMSRYDVVVHLPRSYRERLLHMLSVSRETERSTVTGSV